MLTIETRGPVQTITLNRPDVRNAFNDEVIAALSEAFRSVPAAVRAVVLTGAGVAFSAGGDLDWMRRAAAYTEAKNRADALKLAQLFRAIQNCPAITVARVNGAAFGGGCGLVASVDVAVASVEAKFAFSEVKLGLVPATIAPLVLGKIGAGHARALFTTGEIFDATRAHQIGLVHAVVPPEELDAAVAAKLTAILAAGPKAALEARRLVLEPSESMEEAAGRLAAARAGDEGREGVAAFLEKRNAAWVVTP